MGQSPSDRTLSIRTDTGSLAEYRRVAERVSDLGATHLAVSDLPWGRWRWDRDRGDPYPTWTMLHPSIFELSTPDPLTDYIPQDVVERNRDLLARKAEILEDVGLKASLMGLAPTYLPEAAFRDHPDWRGPRVEQPRRARTTYYAPCIDRDAVLDLYREAVADVCSLVPIERFSLITNDSGAGLCWSSGLYPGRNGPSWCEDRSMANRVHGFLSAWQEGASEAGIDATIDLVYGVGTMPEQEVAAILPSLEPGQRVNGRTSDGTEPAADVGWGRLNAGTNPVTGVPQPFRFAEGLAAANDRAVQHLDVTLPQTDRDLYYDLLEVARDEGLGDAASRTAAIECLARDRVGDSGASDLLTCWEHVDAAVGAVRKIGPDPVTMVGVVNQRWLNRPFVPFPWELDREEIAYYRDYQFQANSEYEAADLMNLQGFEMINGYSGSLLAMELLETALEHLEEAIDAAGSLAVDDDWVEHLIDRLAALRCVYRTIDHAVEYQSVLDRTDYDRQPAEANIWPQEGDFQLRQIQNVTRAEVDNCVELGELLESSDRDLFELAETPHEEDIFRYGPDLVEQLETKIELMLEHQWDLHRLYERRQW